VAALAQALHRARRASPLTKSSIYRTLWRVFSRPTDP
jgi:hypothetical protein